MHPPFILIVFESIEMLYGVDGKGILNRATIAQLPAIEDVDGCEFTDVADDPVFVLGFVPEEDESTGGKSGLEAL